MDDIDDIETLESILKGWDVPDNVIEKFKENGISKETFKVLLSNESYLKELCPHLGHRINLKNKIQNYLESISDTVTASSLNEDLIIIQANCPEIMKSSGSNLDQSQSTSGADISLDLDSYFNIPPSRHSLPEFDLRTILQASPQGNSVLNYYQKYKQLNSQKRNIIVDVIVKYHYTFIVNNNIKPEEYNLLAAKIVALFPKESIYTYYMKAIPTAKSPSRRYVPAKGKLLDKVRNLLFISGVKRRSSKSSCTTDTTEIIQINEEFALNDEIIWLQNNDEPWDLVCAKWAKTIDIRRKQKCKTIQEFIDAWPILKDKRADTLILLDFEHIYNEKSLNFHKNWEQFFSQLLKLRENVITNPDARALVEGLDKITDNDKKVPVQMYLLGFLIPPKGRKSRKIKFSTSESIQGLLVRVDDAGDIDATIADLKKKAAARNDTVQPYVLIQGPLGNFSQIYIIIDDVKYHMLSATRAFDILFKLYHVFNARYPQVAEHLHLVIQKKVYDIHTTYDKVPPYIVDILNIV